MEEEIAADTGSPDLGFVVVWMVWAELTNGERMILADYWRSRGVVPSIKVHPVPGGNPLALAVVDDQGDTIIVKTPAARCSPRWPCPAMALVVRHEIEHCLQYARGEAIDEAAAERAAGPWEPEWIVRAHEMIGWAMR